MNPGNLFTLGSKCQRSSYNESQKTLPAWVLALLWVLASGCVRRSITYWHIYMQLLFKRCVSYCINLRLLYKLDSVRWADVIWLAYDWTSTVQCQRWRSQGTDRPPGHEIYKKQMGANVRKKCWLSEKENCSVSGASPLNSHRRLHRLYRKPRPLDGSVLGP